MWPSFFWNLSATSIVPVVFRVGAMHLLAVSTRGDVRVWDVYSMVSVVNTSLRPIFYSLRGEGEGEGAEATTVRIVRSEVLKDGVPRLVYETPRRLEDEALGPGSW
jgi:hypothetical protein